MHISIFILFCEAYLGILPHLNLFCHLFWLKKKGGGGSKVVGGVYLELRDGMASEYLTVPLNMSLKGWNTRWFYMKQSHAAIHCDANHILESQKSWSERPSSADMEQVRELLDLIKGVKTNGGLVVASFIVHHVQPCKERAHAGFDFKGDIDGTRERTKRLSRDAIIRQADKLFAPNASFVVSKQTRAFNCMNPPPQEKASIVCS